MNKVLLNIAAITAATCLLFACGNEVPVRLNAAAEVVTPGMVQYPQKGSMRLLTDRPPQLETPLEIFKQDITPNEYFFVRWHLAEIVTRIDADTFRLRVGGEVDHPLELSLEDLKTKFTPDSLVALCICSGNSRSTFNPRVPGGQWGNGAMGNAKWKGVRVKDILEMAGARKGATEVTFAGLDKGTLPGIPAFVKALGIDRATDGDVLIAYEMNGQPIPMLNGFPLKLVVPGWYASFWVGALARMEVVKEKYKGFWMEKAYRVVNNAELTEDPKNLAKETVPLTAIKLHSIFVTPMDGEVLEMEAVHVMEGLTFNNGSGISRVEVSDDGGKTWTEATLDPVIDKYSWRRWRHTWTPANAGRYELCVRATDASGYTQPEQQWNRSGYARGFIEHIKVEVN